MKFKRVIAASLAGVMALGLAACGGNNGSSAAPKDGASDASQAAANYDGPKEISVCIASEPDTIDPALNSAVDGATLLAHLFSGLAKWEQKDGKLEIVADAAKELVEGKENPDGTVTYTYTLRDGLKWSDGKDVTAKDFEFAWQRAASTALAADYGYMFEVVDGYDKIVEVDDRANTSIPTLSSTSRQPTTRPLRSPLKTPFPTGTSCSLSRHTSP